MELNLKELRKEQEINLKERLDFVRFWAEYVKTHSDGEWSKQQKELINSQIEF